MSLRGLEQSRKGESMATEGGRLPTREARRGHKVLRALTLALALLETAIFLLLAYFGLTEGATSFRIMSGIATLAALPFFLGTLPALVLAALDRALPLAFALSAGVLLLAVYIWPRM
jgi:predicted anti-sigma-YlaC factor YlaD